MRIAHLYKDYAPVRGGIEHHLQVLAEAQAASGHEVTVLCCASGPRSFRERLHGVSIVRCGRLATLRSMPLSPALIREIRRGRPEILHVHSPFPLGEFALRNAPPETTLVATHHSDVVRQRLLLKLHAPFYRRFLDRADALIATSANYLRTSPWLQPHVSKCRVIPLGVDPARFYSGARPGEEASILRLLFVGRLRYYKGLDTLLEALAQLPPRFRLEVVGNGPMEHRWNRQASVLGLADRVVFRGEVAEEALAEAYRAADLFVLPCNCRAEAFGTVLLEAMACGLACVTSEVGSGTSWVVSDGETGSVVPPRDPAALAHVLDSFCSDRSRLRAFGRAGRRRVEEQFTQDAMVQAVNRLYRTLRTG